MGQKVHPLGFRVGITKKHQSQWFARFNKYKYSQSVLEDRMIRETLGKLFPELLNPILNKTNLTKKAAMSEEGLVIPRITQIKIERGLIPYEIGIQIHAENCELLKSAIDNLKVNRELIVKLQKTRRYLLNLKLKLKDLSTNSNKLIDSGALPTNNQENKAELWSTPQFNNSGAPQITQSKKKSTVFERKSIPSIGRTGLNLSSKVSKFGNSKFSQKKSGFKFKTKLTKQELKRERLIKKRLKRRQSIRNRYRQLILKGLFIKKKGNRIIQTLSLASKKSDFNFGKQRKQGNFELSKSKLGQNSLSLKKTGTLKSVSFKNTSLRSIKNTFSSRIKKKFVTLFIQKMNKKFLSHLKVLFMNYFNSSKMDNSNTSGVQNYLPLGYSKQWSLTRLNTLKNQPISKLSRMVVILEQKLLVKLESLRKEFIAFGSISPQSSESLGYFQILNFLKNLKELVNKLKREQKLQLAITKNSLAFTSTNSKNNSGINLSSSKSLSKNSGAPRNPEWKPKASLNLMAQNSKESSFSQYNSGAPRKLLNSVSQSGALSNIQEQVYFDKAAETLLYKKLDNIQDECRKVKLIEYIKDIVKKHRSENIYFYLSTMSDASKNLRKIKQFTKRHAEFLFGLNLTNFKSSLSSEIQSSQTELGNSKVNILQEKIQQRISKVLEKTAKKTNSEKTLQDIFLEQIEKQRTMCLENLQLTPKISIKFYSVNKKTLEQKASIVAESVVDALEKRKAFRKAIKDAKENLMRTPGVKGVKIQVAGRLNGAEIARTEWVRAGRVPLQTLRANLDYSYRTANTIYGIIGVRVWIFKGYAKLISKA